MSYLRLLLLIALAMCVATYAKVRAEDDYDEDEEDEEGEEGEEHNACAFSGLHRLPCKTQCEQHIKELPHGLNFLAKRHAKKVFLGHKAPEACLTAKGMKKCSNDKKLCGADIAAAHACHKKRTTDGFEQRCATPCEFGKKGSKERVCVTHGKGFLRRGTTGACQPCQDPAEVEAEEEAAGDDAAGNQDGDEEDY